MKKKIVTALLGGLIISLHVQAAGELMVLPASTKLFNAHEQVIKVRNVGDTPLYLSVQLMKVLNPGINPEKKVNIQALTSPTVLATPDKLTLGPNQTRDIRLSSLEEPTQETLYRMYVTPVKALKVEGAPTDKITAPMSVSIGYGVLVRHMPAPGRQQVSWTHRCEDGNITLSNTGNVRVIMSELRLSPAAKAQNVGLYPGTEQIFKSHQLRFNADDKPTTVSCP